ncbi:T9SS type A sorting domain-containing protein [bacterium]|nr:T9SS type A sorting domain-containing protein [bacterium]
MLWRVDGDADFALGETATLTYKVIVNTLITTVNVDNWASILNIDPSMTQWVTGAPLEHYAKQSLDILDVFGFPLKAAINSSLFIQTEAGPRYIVGLQGGAKDPAQTGLGAVLCRVPSTNKLVGWDGGLGNLWYSCGKGLPNISNIPLPLYVTDLFQDSAGRIWLTSWGNEGLFYSDDGAQTWVNANLDISGGLGGAPDGIPDGFAQVYSITEDILGTLFIAANNGDIYRSFDRGVTWQKAKQLPMGAADTAFAMIADPTVPGKLFAGTFGDGMYVSTDFGETWTKPTGTGLASGYVFDLEFDPLSGNLFAGTANGLYYTADAGVTWNSLNSAFPVPSHSPEVRNLAFDQNGALFASTWGQGVWASSDWQAASLSLFALKTSNVLNISISENTVFALLEDGSVQSFRYTSSSLSTEIEDELSEVPSEFVLSQNYPNPFNPTTSIEFSLPQTANINLTVFDVIGRQVAVLVSGQMAAGRHNVNFNASNLPSGMYLYRLSTPTGVITQKMILMK